MAKLKEFELCSGLDSIMGGLAQDGGVIVRDFIDQELLLQLNSELNADIAETNVGAGLNDPAAADFWGFQTKRFSRLAARSRTFSRLLDHDFLHQWATRALDEGYWLNTGQAMIVGPGEKAQRLHRDIGLWPLFIKLANAAPEAMVGVLLALSDFTEEVGATRVVLGSHLWDDFNKEADPASYVSAVMPAGSALLYLGKTVHGAGANTTQAQWRRGLHLSFVLGWLTPEEASPVAVPWEIARTYSQRVQQMLGFISPRLDAKREPRQWLVDFKDVKFHLPAGH